MEVMVLDRTLRKVPQGVRGTIYACGIQLSLGYLNASRWDQQLFSEKPGGFGTLMYDTGQFTEASLHVFQLTIASSGDMGALDFEGRLLCLGREDRQVKINGQRVELGEVQAALERGDQLTVMAIHSSGWTQPRLVAFFEHGHLMSSSSDESALSMARELETRARRKLPAYMVPTAFVPVSKLPLTKNGKVDQGALESVYLEHQTRRGAGDGGHSLSLREASSTEHQLRAVIAEMFGDALISIDADLFGSVLDSLSSMSLAARLREVFNLPVRLQWIVEGRTIQNLALKIDSFSGSEEDKHDERRSHTDPQNSVTHLPPTIEFSSSNSTVFCIHPVSGLSYVFRNLVTFLPEFNIIGINDPHFGQHDAYQNVQEMAELYVSATFITSITLKKSHDC